MKRYTLKDEHLNKNSSKPLEQIATQKIDVQIFWLLALCIYLSSGVVSGSRLTNRNPTVSCLILVEGFVFFFFLTLLLGWTMWRIGNSNSWNNILVLKEGKSPISQNYILFMRKPKICIMGDINSETNELWFVTTTVVFWFDMWDFESANPIFVIHLEIMCLLKISIDSGLE